ncbi:Roadblock/LAMTOR2 domain-containing protein [Comamonas aquatilis]|uniref:roadblock/LC7 domain-containing protein n=1 Tax=Comamonas aquatilis TaxID=1778406 RepID=UPI0039F0B421
MKNNALPVIPSGMAQAGQEILHRIVAPVEGVRIALLCTPDGFEITTVRFHSDLPTERLSAMAGSLMAMARAVANEIGHQDCRRLTFETESGTVVFQAVPGEFPAILCLVVDQNALLGRALWAAAEVATGFLHR